jgi:hypothetical protein
MEKERKHPPEVAKSGLATTQVGVENVGGVALGSGVGGLVKPPGKDDTAPAALSDRG